MHRVDQDCLTSMYRGPFHTCVHPSARKRVNNKFSVLGRAPPRLFTRSSTLALRSPNRAMDGPRARTAAVCRWCRCRCCLLCCAAAVCCAVCCAAAVDAALSSLLGLQWWGAPNLGGVFRRGPPCYHRCISSYGTEGPEAERNGTRTRCIHTGSPGLLH